MLSWTLIALGLRFLACSCADEQKTVTVNNVNIDPALLLQHEKLMDGARLAIERITSQRMSLLIKRQANESHSDDEDDGKYHHHDHDDHHDHDHGKWDIRHSVPGEPTVDYPVYAAVPSTMFTCTGLPQGYYADGEARCQVFHVCSTPPLIVKSSFLCPNGSIFSQDHLVCEWWNMVNCTGTEPKPGPGIIFESDLENKNIVNNSMAIIQSSTDDQSLNANKEQNKVIESDLGDSAMDLNDDDGAGILAITDDSSLNINSNRTVIVSSMLNDSSLYYEEKKKAMIEAAKEDDASNLVDDKKQQIVPMVEDSGYVYEDAGKKNISVFLDDSSNYNKYLNKSQITTSNKDESGVSLENVKTPGYIYETPKTPGYFYETPKIPLTYPTVTTPTTTAPDFYLDFDLEPRKSDGDLAITSIDFEAKFKPSEETKTNLNNQQINSINEGIYNAFTSTTPSTPGPGYYYSKPISTSKPFNPGSTIGYNYSPPSTAFSYPNENKQTSNLNTRYQEDTRYTTAKFPSSKNPATFKTQTPTDFPSTTLSPPTFNENTGSLVGVTDTIFQKFESTSSPAPEINSNAGISQSVSSGIDSADKALNFNSLSVSNDGGSGLLNVGSTVQTPSSSPVVTTVAPPQSSSTDFSNTDTGSIQSSTPPFRGFSGEPFSIKSTTDLPFDDKQLVSQISQTFEDENGTVITRVDFKFASENKTTSEETNTFENKTVTRVITLPSLDLPGDDFSNELNSLSQSEFRVEPSSIEFESSSNPTILPSSQETKESSRLSSVRFTTAIPITTASRNEKATQSPSKLLIPLSNFGEQGSIETGRNSIPDIQEFGSLEKYRVKTTQSTKNLAYYPNKPQSSNLLLNNNFQNSNFPQAQVAITQRTPTYDLNFNNAYVNQPFAYQPSVLRNYQPTQSSLSQSQQQQNVNLLDFILRNNLPQQNYYTQQPLFNPYLPQARSLLNSGLVNNLDLTKMNYLRSNDNYNNGQNLNFLFTANNQAQRYVAPQQQDKYEQRSFQADIVPSVSFDFDSNEGIREFNLAVSTGLVRRKRRDI